MLTIHHYSLIRISAPLPLRGPEKTISPRHWINDTASEQLVSLMTEILLRAYAHFCLRPPRMVTKHTKR